MDEFAHLNGARIKLIKACASRMAQAFSIEENVEV